MKITKIEVDFPKGAELTQHDQRCLDRLVSRICHRWEKENPDQVMWPFGSGAKMTVNPMMLSDDEPIPFDDSVYHVEVASREAHPGERSRYRHFLKHAHPNEMYEDIRDFHVKFGLKYTGAPRNLDQDLNLFRTGFLAEELGEYVTESKNVQEFLVNFVKRASRDPENRVPLEKKLDALVDMVYVALGTAYLHGFDFNEAWRRVHEANMSKVRVTKDTVGPRGEAVHDVVKPPGWKAPDLSDLVRCHECPTPDLCKQEGRCDQHEPNGYR